MTRPKPRRTNYNMLKLTVIENSHPLLREKMKIHYSRPQGFVGRNICYEISCDGIVYGYMVGGSASLFLPGRNDFLGVTNADLTGVINNVFYHVEKVDGRYPIYNFTTAVVREFVAICARDWAIKYNCAVVGFETLVEPPRAGELYLRAGWTYLGLTKGNRCKRIYGQSTDRWSGRRVWDTKDLRPKLVFGLKVDADDFSHLTQAKLF